MFKALVQCIQRQTRRIHCTNVEQIYTLETMNYSPIIESLKADLIRYTHNKGRRHEELPPFPFPLPQKTLLHITFYMPLTATTSNVILSL